MANKFKLIKKYPGSGPVGTVHFVERESILDYSSEFFAPFLFTTEDGVDVFKGDTIFITTDYNKVPIKGSAEGTKHYSPNRRFSTKEAAEKYLESLTSEFKAGQWLYAKTKAGDTWWEYLFRFSKLIENSVYSEEAYQIHSRKGVGILDPCRIISKDKCTPATPEQIERILVEVAKFKGFKHGVKYKGSNSEFTFEETYAGQDLKWQYFQSRDSLSRECNGFIYQQGVWAEIIKEAEPIHIYGCRVEFTEDGIKVGCAKYFSKDIKEFYQLMLKHQVSAIVIQGRTITLPMIKQIIKQLK